MRTDTVPEGKKDNGALKDLEKKVQRDIDDDITPEGGGHTVLSLVKNIFPRRQELRIPHGQDMELSSMY